MVGQALWFRLHVRCSFYHSIHKDNGGRGGTQSQVKKLRDLERKDYQVGPNLIQVIISFCLWPLPFVLHLCWGTLGFLNLALHFGLQLDYRAFFIFQYLSSKSISLFLCVWDGFIIMFIYANLLCYMHEHEWVLEFLGLDMHAWEYQKKKKKKMYGRH